MKKRDLDVIGIIVSCILGIFIGYFLSSKFKKEELEVVGDVESGFIYLIEVGRYDDSEGALNKMRSLKEKDIPCVYVCNNEIYTIYCGVYPSSEKANEHAILLNEYGLDYRIVKEYLFDYLNDVSDSNYDLYNYYLECYYALLNEAYVEIDKKYLMKIDNKVLLQDLMIINSINDNDYCMDSILNIYKKLNEKNN